MPSTSHKYRCSSGRQRSCIYRSNEDMIQIIEYVYFLAPEYKLYVRHRI